MHMKIVDKVEVVRTMSSNATLFLFLSQKTKTTKHTIYSRKSWRTNTTPQVF